MPVPTIKELAANPDFWDYSESQQTAIFDRVDPRFKSLSPEAKSSFLSKLTAKTDISAPPKTESSQPIRTGLTVGGGIVGGIAGTAVAGPGAGILGKMVGAATGTALGAGGAEAWYQVSQHLMNDPDVPKTSKEAATEIAKAGLTEAAWEVSGQTATRLVGKALKPFAKKVTPEAQKVMDWLGKKIKPSLLPSEASDSRILDVMQNVSEGSILGGGKLKEFKANRQEVFDDLADDIIGMFGKKIEPDQVGELFVDAIDNRNRVFRAAADTLYNNATELAEGTKVSTSKLKDFVKPYVDIGEELHGIEAANAGDDLVSAIIGLPDDLSIDAAKNLRSRLLSKIDEFKVINKNAPVIGKAKKLVETLDNQIDKSLSGDALDAWREANRFYKTQSEKFNSALIRRLVKKGIEDPEGIAKAIFKPRNITTIKKIKTALTPKEWESMQSYYIQALFKQGSDIDGVVQGQKVINRMVGKPTSMGHATLKEIFKPEQLKEIFNFADALKVAQKRQSEGLGKMWIQLAQGSAVVTVAAAGAMGEPEIAAGAGAILFGPVVLSRMLVNPSMAKYLTRGFNIPARSPEAVGIMVRLINGARNIKKEISNE